MIAIESLTKLRILRKHTDHVVHGKWIAFERTGESATGKTEMWEVRTQGDKGRLAFVRWHAPWRCYAFWPIGPTVFEQRCLREITLFLRLLNAAQKVRRVSS